MTIGVYLFLAVASVAALAGLAFVSPLGWARLQQAGLWTTVLGASVPPVVYVWLTYAKSDNPALWVFLGAYVSVGAAALGYAVGLFLPATWPVWVNGILGLGVWAVIGLMVRFNS